MKNVKEVIVSKDEAGMSEFQDTGIAIEMGDKAFVIQLENAFEGTIDNVYFKHRESAEKFK